MKNKSKIGKKPTVARLASILGCSRQVIANHIKRGDAPKLDDVPGWTAHLAAFGRVGGQADVDLKKQIAVERLAILRETRAKLERDNAIAAGEMVSFTEARKQAGEAAYAFFDALDLMTMEMPPVLAGLEPIAIHTKLCERREKIRNDLNEKFDAVGTPAK